MNDEMANLRQMVDEAFSGSAAKADAPRAFATTPAARYAGTGPKPAYQAVEDVCWVYQDRNLAENLRRHGWREARRRVMRQGKLSREWISHRGRPPVRLTRRGVEVKLEGKVQLVEWSRMQEQVRARRS